MRKPRFYTQLYFWVLVGMVMGIAVGHFFPHAGLQLKPLGDAFIRLIRMMIAPIIFTTVVVGIAGMGDLRSVGRIGLKSFVYFEVMTTLALVIGWVAVTLVRPGSGMNAELGKLHVEDLRQTLAVATAHHSVVEFLINIIPRTIVGAFAEGEILQVLFVSVLFGVALSGLGAANRPVLDALELVSRALMRMISIIIRLAPLAVFGAMSFTIAKFGVASLGSLAKLMVCMYAACIVFVLVCLGALMRSCGLSVFKLIRYLRDELFIVFGTSSSESVFPRVMAKLEQLGCSRPVVGIVLPSGYSFNLDGSSIYLTVAALFIAQATNTHLTFMQELSVLVVCLLTSKGAAAVVGSGFIALAATLASMHVIPVEGMVLIIGVDWFMAEARAMTNVVGNSVATVVIARWENEFNRETAVRVLNEGCAIPVAEPTPAPSPSDAAIARD
jgi:aerobic C4-dicarboxylate transport protein